jgi:hypothetical protein
MLSTTIVLLGRVLAPGPTLAYDPDGLPRGHLTVALEDSGVSVAVEVWGEHARWVAGRLHPADLVLIRGPCQATSAGAVAVAGVQVLKLVGRATVVSAFT